MSGVDDVGDITDGATTWRFDADFLRSNWTCIWGRGCAGILPEPAPELGHGCCSIGAVLDGEEEARAISALAAVIAPERFQHHEEAARAGIFAPSRPDAEHATRVVDGACIFLNRPGFPGGAGCALHLEAAASGDSPLEWKPEVCWQLPLHVDWSPGVEPGTEVATLRRWNRGDWGDEGRTMAWCCTQDRTPSADAYAGDVAVVDSLAEELTAVVGHEVYVELRRRLGHAPPTDP